MAECMICPSETLAILATAKSCMLQGSPRNKSGHCLSDAQLFQLLCLSCFSGINVCCLNITGSMAHQGCTHTQQGACAALSQGVFPPLTVSASFCLMFKPCLLTSASQNRALFFFSRMCRTSAST